MVRMLVTSFRFRVFLLFILGVVPLVGQAFFSAVEERGRRANQVLYEARRAADLAAANQERLVEGTRQLLTALARLPEVRGPDRVACSRVLAVILREHEYIANLGVVRDDGYIDCTALPGRVRVNAADRAYYKRAVSSRRFSAGDFQIGRITGKMQINFGYPIVDAGGVTGVVFAALDLTSLARIAAASVAGLPAGSTVTILDSHGTLLAHYPRPERWVGQPAGATEIGRLMLQEQGGVARVSGLDGRPNLIGFTPLSVDASAIYGYVAIGIPSASAFAPLTRELVRDVGGVLSIGFALLVMALVLGDRFILRPVQGLVWATERMQNGDFAARSGIRSGLGELSVLGAAFDKMAGSLDQFTGQLREAEAKYRALVEQSLAGVYVIADGRFAYFNEAGARIFGYAVEEVVGTLGPLDLTHPDDRLTVQRHVRARLDGSVQSAHYTFRGVRRDGGVVHIEVFGRRIEYEGRPAIMGTLIDISHRRQAEAQLERQFQQLKALRTIDVAITGSLDLRVLLAVILEQATNQLHVDAADVLLLDSSTNTLEFAARRGFRSVRSSRVVVRLGEGRAGRIALERRPLSETNLQQATGLLTPDLVDAEGFVAYCGVPLVAKGQVRGVLEVFHRSPITMDHEWQSFLEALAGQAAIAVDNAVLFSDLQGANANLVIAYDTTLEGWSRALDLRDKETEGHTIRVTEITVRLARAMGMSEEDIVRVRRGALLHDIGKMGIPDRILLKPASLTDEEWAVMRRHPAYAHELLSPIPYLRPALDIPYCHHERWDGTGYPRGLRGTDIPLAARIFAVVDAWDALRSERPYRSAWPEDRVREYLRQSAGTLFDPAVVDAFLTLELPALAAIAQ